VRFGLGNIGRIYCAIGIGVAEELAHLHTDVASAYTVVHIEQCYRDPLRITYTSEIDGNSSRPAAATSAHRSRTCGDCCAVEGDGAREGKDKLIIIGRPTAPAFDAGATSERQVDVEGRAVVQLSRDNG